MIILKNVNIKFTQKRIIQMFLRKFLNVLIENNETHYIIELYNNFILKANSSFYIISILYLYYIILNFSE